LHASNKLGNDNSGGGFFDRVFGTKVEKATQAHSVLLADQQVLYELQSMKDSLFFSLFSNKLNVWQTIKFTM